MKTNTETERFLLRADKSHSSASRWATFQKFHPWGSVNIRDTWPVFSSEFQDSWLQRRAWKLDHDALKQLGKQKLRPKNYIWYRVRPSKNDGIKTQTQSLGGRPHWQAESKKGCPPKQLSARKIILFGQKSSLLHRSLFLPHPNLLEHLKAASANIAAKCPTPCCSTCGPCSSTHHQVHDGRRRLQTCAQQ